MKTSVKWVIVAAIILLIIEAGLRLSGRLKTYSENNFCKYQSAYDSKNIKHIYVWNENDSVIITQSEFSYTYLTNHEGLVDSKMIDTCNPDQTIVFFGDSFVFGMGAPQDSSLPVLLSPKINMNIINAGIPGSDPFYQKVVLDRIFKPKGFYKYIFMVNVSDLYDYVIRGGKERFLQNNEIAYRKAPWFEPFYHYLYICRAIVHVVLRADYSLLPEAERKVLKEKAMNEYELLFKEMAKENEITIIFQPYARQYVKNEKIQEEVFNYEYLDKIENALKSNNIRTINLYPELNKYITENNYLLYSWNIDGHYNSKGYELLSEIISKELIKE